MNNLIVNTNFISINDKLLTIKNFIKQQKQELKKADASLSFYKNCLESQNNELNVFLKEENQIEEEIKSRIEKERRVVIIKNEDDIIDGVISKDNPKRMKITESEDESNTKVQCTPNNGECVNANASIKQLQMPQLRDKSIHCIHTNKEDIYIGGSEGLLLRYTDGDTHVFDKCTDDDILQIFTIIIKNETFIIARTNTRIIKYTNTGVNKCIKDVPQIRNVSRLYRIMFITFTNGSMNWLYLNNLSNVNRDFDSLTNVRCYYPEMGKPKFSLLSNEDSNLYKVMNDTLKSPGYVKGVTNVKNILKVNEDKILCYSDVKIWILNRELGITGAVDIEEGIHFVSCINNKFVVVDANNTVRVYVVKKKDFWTRVSEENINGNITAVTIDRLSRKVFFAVGDCIYIL